jgi:hypothetical protein
MKKMDLYIYIKFNWRRQLPRSALGFQDFLREKI